MGELKNIKAIRKMLEDKKTELYAIENPELAQLEEYQKTLYLELMCTVVQYENNPSEMQLLYLKRIIKGMGMEEPPEKYMKRALEITGEEVSEFLSMAKEHTARYYFALEGMILSSLGEQSKENYRYLAELIELCGVTGKEMEYLSHVAKSVLQQDAALYDAAKEYLTEETGKLLLLPYIGNYYGGAVIDTRAEKYYYAPDVESPLEIDFPTKYTERKITFRNLTIRLKESWDFTGCETVEFINCRVSGESGANLQFRAMAKLVFDHSEFYDMDNRVAVFHEVNEIDMEHCLFEHCGWTFDDDMFWSGRVWARAGVFHFTCENQCSFRFVNNRVEKCYIKASTYRSDYGVSGVLCGDLENNFVCTITGNEFIGCECINNGIYKESIIWIPENEVVDSTNRATGKVTCITGQ